jgi:deoxyadenosine/deoxycytidine kinase
VLFWGNFTHFFEFHKEKNRLELIFYDNNHQFKIDYRIYFLKNKSTKIKKSQKNLFFGFCNSKLIITIL